MCGAPAPSVEDVVATVQSLKKGRRKAEAGRQEFMDEHAAAAYGGWYTLRHLVSYHPDKLTVSSLSRRKSKMERNGVLSPAAKAAANRVANGAAAVKAAAAKAAANRAAKAAANRAAKAAANRAAKAAANRAAKAAAAKAAANRNNANAAAVLASLRTSQPARHFTWNNIGAGATLPASRRRLL